MIELTITPEDIAKVKSEITDWWNADGSFNVRKMQADIKKELIKGQQKRRQAHRQSTKDNPHIHVTPPVEIPRPNLIIERMKQVQL